MDHSRNDEYPLEDFSHLDQDEPSWRNAVIGFVVISLAVGLFFLFWVGLFRISSP